MDRRPGVYAWIRRWRGASRAGRAHARVRTEHAPHSDAVDLETCARQLARRQRTPSDDDNRKPAHLKRALAAHEQSLRRAYATARVAAAEQRRIEPAAEWLLDNFHLIRTQLRELSTRLSRRQLLQLPRVIDADDRPVPRMLDIARALVAQVDGRVDPEQAGIFLATYQTETTLVMAELWILPDLLRVALIERIAQGSRTIAKRLDEYARADYWARYLTEMSGTDPAGMLMYVADMARLAPDITPAWVAEFYRLLEGKHPSLALALTWAEQQLHQRGLSVAEVIDEESRAQASDQVSIANCINSLRLVGRNNWSKMIESVSAVDRILTSDPAQAYALMDFTTRGMYRHAVEILARRGKLSEVDVAQRAVDAAQNAQDPTGDPRVNHVGYQLVGRGRRAFERSLGEHMRFDARIVAWMRAWPATIYLGAIASLTFAITFFVAHTSLHGLPLPLDLTLLIALIIAASHPAVAIVNWLISMLVPPELLPRMSFAGGIPEDCRTLVVVPWLLGSERGIAEQLDALEIRYLGNRDPNLHFALLTDFPDAPEQEMPADEALLTSAITGIERLNEKYPQARGARFHLFHRPREWNARENIWMGFERKRGKLGELNRALRGSGAENFSAIAGDLNALQDTRYVITLDADTQLPPQAARRLIETMAHPLNRPWFHKYSRRVIAGYGILQPRVSVLKMAGNASRFSRLFSDDSGLDPYTRAVSDVYQDLFGEASFVGKGIYDIDAFSRSVGTRFPNDLILSHDLLEGSYARTGLVSDVELIEHQPNRYSVEARRRHRWTRGDWQIVQWLLPIVPGPRRRGLRNTLKAHHRWKILDNLRRGLVPLALLVLLLRGWMLSPIAIYWTAVGIAFVLAAPVFISLAQITRNLIHNVHPRHWRDTFRGALEQLIRTGFALAVIPFEAFLNLDAILRSAARLLFTRKRLLEWTPMEDADRAAASSLNEFVRLMWVAPACALVSGFALLIKAPSALAAASPLLMLWLLAPWLAAELSFIPRRRGQTLDAHDRRFLGGVARRTWHWFETFVNDDSHWLPPDNYQEFPEAKLAHRTSPTNVGMALLANLTAHDFGYSSAGALLSRCARTLDTLDGLPRYRGHFYNWYDTQTLAALPPHYVSTVDSGNLMGCLLVLANALEHLDVERLVPRRLAQGIDDTARVVADCAQAAVVKEPNATLALAATLAALDALIEHAQDNRDALPVLHGLLARIDVECGKLRQLATPIAQADELHEWLDALCRQSAAAIEELDDLAPWLGLGDSGADDEHVRVLLRELENNPTQHRALAIADEVIERVQTSGDYARDKSCIDLCNALREMISLLRARQMQGRQLAARCRELADMDLAFLWDKSLQQFTIGYNVEYDKRDEAHYDLLASEARLASYIAIAQNQVPQSHWFALGRLLTHAAGRTTLVSWSGSMFEYLMPLLLMPGFEDTLLDASCRAAVAAQIQYGVRQEAPWGISESAYNVTDAQLNYQYRAFGVPGLGLKQGLGDDLVIAPYACAMSLMLEPAASVRNLQALQALGALTRYGFYEALDYTEGRVAPDQDFAMVRSFMVHHHGMSFLALSSLLHDQPMQKRFMREPMFRAYDLLLQEKIPAATPLQATLLDSEHKPSPRAASHPVAATLVQMDTAVPRVHLLSNGRYHVMLTQTGAGYSQWRNIDVTRWSGDPTRDADGMFCYLRDVDSGKLWSTTWQPCAGNPASDCSATFSQARAEFRRTDYGIECETLVAVSAEDDIELRRVRLTNRSSKPRTIDLTSYAEIALSSRAADAAHPAFSKLFVQTELLPERDALLASRRPRAADEVNPWLLHLMTVRGATTGHATFETDREKFLGRLHDSACPQAVCADEPLDNSAGAVLDPCMAIRRRVQIPAGRSVSVDFITGVAPTRENALALIGKYREPHLHERVFELAWTHEQVMLQQLNMSARDAQTCERIAAQLLYAPEFARSAAPAGLPPQSALWKHGISGDLPIVLVRVANSSQIDLVRRLIQAHGYWQMRGLHVDLLIWNEELSGYRQELQEHILYLLESSREARGGAGPGRMFAWRVEHLPAADRALMLSIARCVFNGGEGRLVDQIARRTPPAESITPLPTPRRAAYVGTTVLQQPQDLQGFNGYGGFSADGNEYAIWLPPDVTTPAPWCNVLANETFGSVVSESGSAYTFAENAHEFRLTPWFNDPLGDPSGEAIWLRDEETGEFWSPTPIPTRSNDPYLVAHGFGYTRHQHAHADIVSETTVFVAREQPVKLTLVKLRNAGTRARTISVTGYIEWVLGEQRARTATHLQTRVDPASGAMLAGNFYNEVFGQRVAFHALGAQHIERSADRRAFIGRNRSLSAPLGMLREALRNDTPASPDPCSVLRTTFELEAGEEIEIVFALGAANDVNAARTILREFGDAATARAELQSVREHWHAQLGQLVLHTPDENANHLANGWLLYQVLAARILARSGFYQSGGAWGFRDQLQDTMSLLHTRPDLARAQLLRCAGRQFRAGDVQHWWHPPTGKGVRTHISDDYLWLPWATSVYVQITGDVSVLDEPMPFIEGRELAVDEESVYDSAHVSLESASLYEHCVRAIRHGLRFGAHGLPLIGSGDWNDGMNRIGHLGRGESVWLAFFLHDVLDRFAPIAAARGDEANVSQWRGVAATLVESIERDGWDGNWYRRAYTDDGMPVGSAADTECRIDSLPQSWAVLADATDRGRASRAMDAVDYLLVRDDLRLVQLFAPPFDHCAIDPGYIKGYVPGVRENGGQYTHAAVWVAMAMAKLGRCEEAWRLARLLNPLNHASTQATAAHYRVEPYVLAADVYMAQGHEGRGGWTWYTGSAGWMYRLLIESLLGLQRRGSTLTFTPCVPDDWQHWSIDYREGGALYRIAFQREGAGNALTRIAMDGAALATNAIALRDDGREHAITVSIGVASGSDIKD